MASTSFRFAVLYYSHHELKEYFKLVVLLGSPLPDLPDL